MTMAEVDPPPLKEVKDGTLQINGIMSRLQVGKMDVETAVNACMELTEKIDIAASNISKAVKLDNFALRREIKSVRQVNVKLHQKKYQLEKQLEKAEEKITQLQDEGEKFTDMEILSFSQTVEKSLKSKQGEMSKSQQKAPNEPLSSPAAQGEMSMSQEKTLDESHDEEGEMGMSQVSSSPIEHGELSMSQQKTFEESHDEQGEMSMSQVSGITSDVQKNSQTDIFSSNDSVKEK